MADDASAPVRQAHAALDGVAKVTGAARYASDEPVANPAFAYLVTSTIARGRIAAFDLDGGPRRCRGVLDILTHENVGDQAKPPPQMDGGQTTTTLESDRVWHDGQIIAVVVADTFEAAREAAHKVEVDYAAEPPSATFDSPGVDDRTAQDHARQARPQGRRRARPPSPRRRSRSTRATRRRPSTTTRSSCSPPPASGTGPT